MQPHEIFQRFERDPEAFTRIPTATYRLQLSPHLSFAEARALVPYLAALGISDCHFSPYLLPCSSRSHGYDVADHGQLDRALGSEADYDALVETLRSHGIGQIMDIVPNHMGIAGNRNLWWADVLENGRASASAGFFDIEWDPIKPELKDKVLLPILGDQYGRVLESQELRVEFRDGAFGIRYYDTVLPVAPCTYVALLEWRLEDLQHALGAEHPHLLELRSIITGLGHLPPRTEQDPARLEERQREKEVLKRRLAALVDESPEVRAFVEANILRINDTSDAHSVDRLDELLGNQTYRLSFWQVAGDEINYRRFFDINELAAIRMEEPAVFELAHRLVFRLVRQGAVTGLRIDHPDGLFAPARYLRDLQRRCFLERARHLRDQEGVREEEPVDWEQAVRAEFERRQLAEQEEAGRLSGATGGGWSARELRRRWSAARAERGGLLSAVQAMLRGPAPTGSLGNAFYIVTEKILMPDERLPTSWPVAGTTGYEFLNVVNGLFVNPSAHRTLTNTYARFIGTRLDFSEVAYQSKRLVMDTSMASEIAMLGHRLGRISERRRSARDFTDRMLTEALREIVACFPVYRTYIATEDGEVTEGDRRYVEEAVAEARRRNPSVSTSVFEFIQSVLCLELPPDATEGERREIRAFVGRFQQLTGPFTAKGIEDTAFYRYHRLISLNEVGGDPDAFGTGLGEFHQRCLERQARWPTGISILST
ncbi:MAG TPA: malto-oligosyltrehalose synthase, partial [Candidatus Methylomirabilis sp.]|nr:malto-oligosyltrehalose synthase [Candidatus Methylomirabilis sp.]